MDYSAKTDIENIPWYMKTKYEYTHDWFLMSSPFSSMILLAAYLAFVLKLGPAFMEKRQPYKLKTLLLIHNTFQVLFSGYIFYRGMRIIFTYGLFGDSKCSFENDLTAQKWLMADFHLYFVAKVTDLLDTVFFVLRKKKNQITFLHCYHHSVVMMSTLIMLKYAPSYSIVFLGTINSFVHSIMYAYYGLSTFPHLEKYLWWKKHITSMQLIQFVLIIIHLFVFNHVSKCSTAYFLYYNVLLNTMLMIYLFGSFYVKSYVKKDSHYKLSNEKLGNEVAKTMNGIARRYTTS